VDRFTSKSRRKGIWPPPLLPFHREKEGREGSHVNDVEYVINIIIGKQGRKGIRHKS